MKKNANTLFPHYFPEPPCCSDLSSLLNHRQLLAKRVTDGHVEFLATEINAYNSKHPPYSFKDSKCPGSSLRPQEGWLAKIIFWLTRNLYNILCLGVSETPSEGSTLCILIQVYTVHFFNRGTLHNNTFHNMKQKALDTVHVLGGF